MRSLLITTIILASCDPAYPSAPHVALEVICGNGTSAYGIAVPVSSRHLLTARHVVDGCGIKPFNIVASWDGRSTEVAVDARTEEDVVRLAALTPSWIRWAKIGEDFAVVGQSGRPVFDEHGRLVGIVVRRYGTDVRIMSLAEWQHLLP